MGQLDAYSIDELRQRFENAQNENDTQRQLSLMKAVPQSPDKAVKDYNLSQRFGVPMDAVAQDPSNLDNVAKVQDATTELRRSPVLDKWLSMNEAHMAVAHDDLQNLGKFAESVGWWRSVKAGLESGKLQNDVAALGFQQMIGADTPQTEQAAKALERRLAELEIQGGGGWWNRAAQLLGQEAPILLEGLAGGSVAAGTAIVAGQLGPQVALPEEVVTVPAAFMTGMMMSMGAASHRLEGGSEYRDLLEQGISPDVARVTATGVGLANSIIELAGFKLISIPYRKVFGQMVTQEVGKIFKDMTAKQMVGGAVKTYALTWAGETGQEVAQEIVQIVGDELSAAYTQDDFQSLLSTEAGRDQIRQRLAGIFEQVGKGMAIMAVPGVALGLAGDFRASSKAQRHADAFKALGDTAAATKLSKRSQELFASYAQILGQDAGLEEIRIPAQQWQRIFTESGKDPKAAANEAGVGPQYDEALARDGDLVVPFDAYASKIAPTEYHQALVPHMRAQAGDMTLAESQQWQKDYQAQMEDEADRILAQKAEDKAYHESAKRVHDSIKAQVMATGRFTADVAEKYASLHRAFATVIANRLGTTPEEVYQRFNLQIQGEQGPMTYDQAGQLKTETSEFKAWFGDSKVVDEKGKPLVVYHGTFSDFEKFKRRVGDVGMHFGTAEAASDRVAYMVPHRGAKEGASSQVMPVYLRLRNPLRMRDVGFWNAENMKGELLKLFPNDAKRIGQEFNRYSGLKSTKDIREFIKSKGYDGIVYRNTGEVSGAEPFRKAARIAREAMEKVFPKGKHSFDLEDQKVPEYIAWSKAEEAYRQHREASKDDSYIAFEPTQIKSVFNRGTFSPTDANILNQGPVSDAFAKYRAEQEALPISDMIKEPLVNKDGKYRKNANGDVTGAPPGIKTKRQITAIVNRALKFIEDPMSQMPSSAEWYEVSGSAIRAVTHGDPHIAENMVRMMAVLSATNQVGGNVTGAIRAVYQLAAGEVAAAGRFPNKFKLISQQIIDAKVMNTEVPGVDAKVMSFYRNLWDATFQSDKYENAATMDMRMARLYGYDLDTFGAAQYRFANYITKQITDKYNAAHDTALKPRQIQAALWVYARNRERFGANIGAELAVADRSAFDTYIERAKQHITVEAVPSETSGLFPEILDAPLAIREQFTHDALGLLLDEDGQNGLFRRLNVPLYQEQPGSGSWEGRVNPNEILSVVSQKVGGKTDTTIADYIAKALVYVYSQDGVPWFRLDPTITGGTKGYAIRFTEAPSFEVQEAFLEHIQQTVKADFTRVGDDLFLLNYTDLSDKKFSELVTAAVNNYDGPGADQISEVGHVKAEGNFIAQDWSDPEAAVAQLEADLAAADRPDLLRWLRGRREAVGRLIADYRDRLAQPATYYQGEALTSDRGPGAELRTERVDSPPVREDGSVELVHWSKRKDLEELDPAYHGDGIAGAESKRKQADPANWVDRTYDGIAVGLPGGYTRESGLGPYRYIAGVPADKLYDLSKDPDGLLPKAREEIYDTGGNLVSTYERMVRDAGYDGYWRNHESMGLVAAIYKKLTPERVNSLRQERRGSIAFGQDITQQPSVISLLEKADLSTFLHETGHFFFEAYRDIANQIDAPKQIRDDMNVLLKFVGVDSLEAWNLMTPEQRRAGHEKVARAFEAYLFEGKSPSVEMRGLFARLRSWLMQVYKDLRNLNVELDPEVRGVFDRMLASDDQIEQAEDMRSAKPIEELAEVMGPVEAAEYKANVQAARNETDLEMSARSLKNMRWLSGAKNRLMAKLQKDALSKRRTVRAEVEQDLRRDPVYRAYRFLSRGELDNPNLTNKQRRALEEASLTGNTKLDAGVLKEMFGEDEIWKQLKTGKYGVVAKEGMHPEIVADIFGFSSVDEMVQKLAFQGDFKDTIEGLTNQRMLERYGDMTSEDALSRAADEVLHNDMRTRVMHTELRALDKLTGRNGRYNIPAKVAQAYAADRIARLRVRDLKPAQYAAAEAKAARQVRLALSRGDTAQAAESMRAQLLNHHFFKEASKQLAAVEKAQRYLGKFNTAKAYKGLRGETILQIQALLARFDLRKGQSLKAIDERKATLAQWIQDQLAENSAVDPGIAEQYLNENYRKSYKDMNIEEFLGLRDTVRQLEVLARREHKMYIESRNQTFEQEIDSIMRELRDANPDSFDAMGEAHGYDKPFVPKLRHKFGKKADRFLGQYMNIENLAQILTGGGLGQLHDSIVERLSRRADWKISFLQKLGAYLKPAMDQYSILAKRDFGRKGIWIPEIGESMTREQIVNVALHYGNKEGRQRLMGGYGWSDPQIQAMLGKLEPRDWTLVDTIWHMMDDIIWPELEGVNKRTQGLAPPKVEPMPYEINGVQRRGGYYPLVYDPELDYRQAKYDDAAAVQDMLGGNVWRSQARQGSSQQRLETVNKRLQLDFGAMNRSIGDTVHDIAFREAVADTYRILSDRRVRTAIETTGGIQIHRAFVDRVRSIAAVPHAPQGPIENIMNKARQNTLVVAMGFSFKTFLINATGIFPAAARVNPFRLAHAVQKFFTPWKMREHYRFVMDRSEYMHNRNLDFDRDLQRSVKQFSLRNKLTPEFATYFTMIGWMDRAVAVPTWMAAYEQAMAGKAQGIEANDEARAATYADHIVRTTQGSGRNVDISKVMEGGKYGELRKLFTMFYSYFNAQLGLLVRSGVVSKRALAAGHPFAAAKFFTDFAAVVLLPAITSALLYDRCRPDLESGDGWLHCFTRETALYFSGFFPFWRDVVAGVWSRMDPDTAYYGYKMSPVQSAMEGMINAVPAAVDFAQGEGDKADAKKLVMGMSYAFGLPGYQIWRTADHLDNVWTGESELNPWYLVYGEPKK